MAKKPELSEEDLALFREAVADAEPLEVDRVAPQRSAPAPVPRHSEADEREVMRELLEDPPESMELETGDELYFCRPGLQHSLMRRLRRGQYSIAAELDLHGCYVEEARAALVAFLQHCRDHGLQCVRIIHGKGNRSPHRQPVLKQKVNYWLQQRQEVLAFCSARPVDGGTGAVYVLLKRR